MMDQYLYVIESILVFSVSPTDKKTSLVKYFQDLSPKEDEASDAFN